MTERPSPRAAVVFRSHTGTTERYARRIAAHLALRGVTATVESIGDCDTAGLADVDLLFLGCWTNGWFVVHQHPDAPWLAFARDLPDLGRPTVGLFTTYRLATGSMFGAMRRALARTGANVRAELRSRSGELSEADRRAIDDLLAAGGWAPR
jgi:flavodoxin